jgi:23S rRNA (cytosine1962-C5)-methyltransferase
MQHTVRVNRKGADRVLSGHPWIFSSDITDRGQVEPGEAVRVLDPREKLLGTALYSSTSQITLRMISSRAVEPDRAFLLGRIRNALSLRSRVVQNSDAYRLISSEADLLPGLIVDRYGSYLVLQSLTQAMDRLQALVVSCLQELLQPAGILARNDASVRKLEGLVQEKTTLSGGIPEAVAIEMNGLKLQADLQRGQKTGIYLDQRENYVAAARYARGRMLDCFTSTGGFALHAAKNVESAEAIDSSESALATATRTAAENQIQNVQFRQADVFDFLAGINRKFNTIVLDPPAFAKSRKQLEDAARGYKEINLRALKLLEPGGVLVTCSCSHHFSEAALFDVAAEAALDSGRTLRVLERRAQASDHPILLTVPETLYLKCLIFEAVED